MVVVVQCTIKDFQEIRLTPGKTLNFHIGNAYADDITILLSSKKPSTQLIASKHIHVITVLALK